MLIRHFSAIESSLVDTNQPLRTQKKLSIITVFPIPHNGLVILHINDILYVPSPVPNSVLPNSFGLSFS